MGEWYINGSNGNRKATVKKLEYSGEFMNETYVTCDVYAPSPISFSVGDYLEYRGERFVIDYDATRKKQARVNTYGSGFLYEGMRFLSYVGELKKCEFLDFVPSDNQIHYSQLPEFSFFAADVSDLADRIQANLDRLYTGNKAWTVSVAQGFEGKTNIDVQVSKITCFDALKLAYDQFEAQFVIRGRVITIGTAGSTLETNYKYGKGNGLKTIERSVDESDALITRLRAYGNTTNMPANYYRNLNTLCYADYYETLGPYADKGADLHFHPGGNKFANNWFTEKSGADAGHYWVEVSLDEELWVTAIASTNAGNGSVGFSVVSTGMYGSNTQDMLDAFNTQLGSTGRLYFRKGVNYDNWGAGKESGSSVPASLFIDRLMLPSFPTNPDPYIDSSNIGTLGIREKSVYFDGSDPELPDIHPSLEGMTAHDIDPVHGSSSDYLDEIAADATEIGGGDITTDGQFVNMDEVPGFQVKVKDIGFDINSYLSTETATLSMKSGKCGGREFTIVKVEKAVGGGYLLTCQRTEDINLYFPYKDYPIEAGDKFVLTGIEMPEIYVTAASNRLLAAAQEYLAKHSQPQYVYAIKMDDIWMQRQADGCESVGDSYYWNIKEGDVMQVQDNDLGIYEGTAQNPTPISEVIDRLTIREGYDPIPQIEVVLRKEKPQGTIGILQNRIRQLEAQNAEQLKTINRQNDYITLVLGDRIKDIENQADHQQISWFGTNTPNVDPDNPAYPIDQWTDDWSNHIGDMYYDKDGIAPDNTPIGYVFEKNNNSYQWTVITDPHTLQALAIASEDKDTIDGKRRVFVITAGSVPLPPYEVGDLWVNAIYPQNNTVTDEAQHKYYNDVLKCITDRGKDYSAAANVRINDWSLASKYTDDSKLNNFLDGYSGTLTTITNQIDQKAETWYQANDPSTGWDADEKEMHEGDIWYNTAPDSNGNCHTYIYRKNGNNYEWQEINGVPEDLFDTIDGKASIYVTWGAWGNDLQVKDLFIPSANTTQGGVTYYANKVYRCTNKTTPTFQEIDYTDDAALNAFLNGYTGTLTGIRTDISNAQTTADNANTAAAAAQATADALDYLKQAYSADNTLIDHGLILSTIVALRDSSNNVWSGISGAYDSTKLGNGIAAWYGGGMIDKDVSAVSNAAKSLFRFDGTGYLAGGNITWNSDGSGSVAGGNLAWNAQGQITTIAGQNISATTSITIGTGTGNNVLTQAAADGRYITKAWFNKFFKIHIGNDTAGTNVLSPNTLPTDGTDYTIETLFGLWSKKFLSALGLNSQGGGGTGSFEWQMLTEYDGDASHKINNNYLNDNVITAVNQTSTTGYVSNVSVGTNHTLNVTRTAFPTASSSTLGMVKVGTTLAISSGTLNLKSGIIATTGTYRSVTVDTYGRVTAGTNPTTISGYKISDAKIENGTITLGSNTITPLTSSSNIAWNKITGKPSWIGDDKPSYNFSEIGDKPTTLGGYGITDAVQSISISGDYLRQTKIDSNGNAVTSNVAHILERQYTYSYPQDKFATEGWYRVASIQSGAGGSSSLLFIDRVYNNANNEAYIFAISIAHAGDENANATITQVAGKYNTQLIDKIRVNGSNTSPYSHYIDIHIKTTTAGNTIKLTIVGAANLYNDAGIIFNPTTSKTYEVNIVNGSSTSRGHTISGTLSVGGATTLTGLLTAKNNAIIRNTATNYHATYLEIGQIRFVYDHTKNAIKVIKNDGTNANFYATGTVSALGANTSGSGGTGIEMPQVWEALAQAGNNEPINYTHIQTALTNNGYMHSFSKTNPTGANVVTDVSYNSGTGTLSVTRGSLAMNALAPRDIPTTLATFYDGDNLIYTRVGGSNSVADKPYGVDAFGVITMRTASGYYGQILYGANGSIYCRTDTTANIAGKDWLRLLSSSNYSSYTYDKNATYNKKLVLASSATSDGQTATFRELVASDIPDLGASYLRKSNIQGGASTNVNANDLSQANTLYVPTGDMGGSSATGTWSNFPTARPSGGFSLMNIAEGAYCRQIFGTYSSNKLYVRSQYYKSGKLWYDWSELLDTTSSQTITGTKSFKNGLAVVDTQHSFSDTAYEDLWIGWGNVTRNVKRTNSSTGVTETVSETNRVLRMYCYETKYSDMVIGTSGADVSQKGLYFQAGYNDTGYTGKIWGWGIGTFNPQYTLDIVGTLGVSSRLYANGKITVNYTGGTSSGNELIALSVGANATYNCISFAKSSSWTNGYNWASGINASGFYLWNAANGGVQQFAVTNAGQTVVKSLKIGTITLTDDNGLLKIDKGVYSLGTVSALGANSSSSGGGGADINDVWDSLTNSTGTSYSSTTKIHSDHIDIKIGGDGNAVTGVTTSGTSITLNKGTSFLPLTGGTLANTTGGVLNINNTTTSATGAFIYYKCNGTTKAATGYLSGFSFIDNETNTSSKAAIGVLDNGTPVYRTSVGTTSGQQTLLHTGNYTSYTYSSTTSRTAKYVLAAPNGNNGAAAFRALVASDLPDLSGTYAKKTDAVTALGTSGSYLTWTKNGTTSNIIVPYATYAERLVYSTATTGGNTAGWVEVARCDITKGDSQDTVFVGQHNIGASFIIASYYRKNDGIVNLSYRKENNATSPNVNSTYIRITYRDKALSVDRIKMVIQYNYPSTGKTRVSLYYNTQSWSPLRFMKIDDGNFTTKTTQWTMLNTATSYQTGGSLPTESSTCKWISCTDDSYAGSVTTEVDNTSTLYLLGVPSDATSTIKRNTQIRMFANGELNAPLLKGGVVRSWETMEVYCSGNPYIDFHRQNSSTTTAKIMEESNGVLSVYNSIVAASEVTASSDERLKTINGGTNLTIKDIASAPSIRFTWNDKRDEKVHIGSIAQYWEKALPEAVSYDGNGIMSLNYGALALVSAITIARGLMQYEDRLTKLEKKNKRLERRISALERRIA